LAPAADAANFSADLGPAPLGLATVAVVGLGLMGASLAMALKERGHVVVGCDSDERTLQRALTRGVVSSAAHDIDIVGIADVVVVAVPILAMHATLNDLRGRAAGKVVTDMASTKVAVMGWAEQAGIELVGGHPMCGREASGIDAADATLFEGAPWILTAKQPEVIRLVESVGAHPVVMSAEEHDRLVSGVSHAAFLLSVAYVLSMSRRSDWPQASRVAASGFRDLSRLAAGDPEMYAGVSATNRENVIGQLDEIAATLAQLRRHLEAGDSRLIELFEEARRVRERWAKEAAAR
jgi:prephenate dehydrogenase